jgi:hypothetical protein
MTSQERAEFVRGRLPTGGLFAEKEWRIAPGSFPLSAAHAKLLEQLGPLLHGFNQACNLLYRHSVAGKQPAWIHRLLDAGKPEELVALSRHAAVKAQVPAVIRPDLILTEEGFALSEIDSVPGGIGLTAWLNETYAELGDDVLGGRTGMREGFGRVVQDGVVVISEEAAGYRPEMEWLVGSERVCAAENYAANGRPMYRFFECFDWEKLETLRGSWSPEKPMTAPLKPYLEEKLWLALFWSRPLQEFWRQELGEKGQQRLQQMIPYSWVMDPAPLPPHAVIPELGVQDFREMGKFSQKQRDLILKISGFSPKAWGARGVYLGSDMPGPEWEQRIGEALASFETSPYVLQRFIKGALVEQDYLEAGGEVARMKGRARVCPYYFAGTDQVKLGGVLVTLCPADKKLLHGMRDAVISPAVVGK